MTKITSFTLLLLAFLSFRFRSYAMDEIYVNKEETVFFITAENIEFVDISDPLVTGIIEENNPHILRVKIDKYLEDGQVTNVTLVTERGLYNYTLVAKEPVIGNHQYNSIFQNFIKMDPNTCMVINPESLGIADFKKMSLEAISKKSEIKNISNFSNGIKYRVNNIYAVGNYILVDISARNKTNIQYNISDVRFRLEDTKQFKATVSQEIELKPLFALYQDDQVIIRPKREYRNIYVFNKFTYPDQKTFIAEISEKGISGRKVGVSIDYNQLLAAKTLY